MQGREDGKVYDLDGIMASSGRHLLTLGRGPKNSINLLDFSESFISRKHCTLENRGYGYWVLRDGQWDSDRMDWLDSTNGTYVDSSRIGREGRFLKPGDIITVGDMKLRFETI